MENSAPLFKGATRPACIWGIPIKPFIGVTGAIMLLSFWAWIPLMISLFPVLYIMHRIAKEDDQRFLQLFLAIKVNLIGTGNKHYWGGVNSFSPVSYKQTNLSKKK